MAIRKICTVKELFKFADNYANRAEAQVHAKNLQSSKDKPESSKSGGKKTKPGDKHKGPDTTIATVDRNKSHNTGDNKSLSRGGGKWCPIHRSNQHNFDK